MAVEDPTPTPQLTVQCIHGGCEEEGKEKQVDAGVVIGNKVMMYSQMACMTCGSDVQLVQ